MTQDKSREFLHSGNDKEKFKVRLNKLNKIYTIMYGLSIHQRYWQSSLEDSKYMHDSSSLFMDDVMRIIIGQSGSLFL